MSNIRLFTIGFTKKNADEFFSCLRHAGVRRIIDIRLNNTSQLAGFAKRDDLAFFLREITGATYIHRPEFAPTAALRDAYRHKTIDWHAYETEFRALMRERSIEKTIDRVSLESACLLCAEPTPDHCHRRLVAEYFRDAFQNVDICHL